MKGYRKLINPTLIAWGATLLVAWVSVSAQEESEESPAPAWEMRMPIPETPEQAAQRWSRERQQIEKKLEEQKREDAKRTKDAQSSLFDHFWDVIIPSARAAQAPVAGTDSTPLPLNVEITELARSLKNDPYLIYRYVHDNIHFESSYGSKKGALGALLDQSGNSFDQSHLLVEMLRAASTNLGASWSVSYQFGQLDLSASVHQSWLGVSTLAQARTFLDAGGIPRETSGSTLVFSHVWVKAVIGGTTYIFDPAIKLHEPVSGIDLATATQFNQSTFMTSALAGSTSGTDWIKDVSQTNIRSGLQTAAQNLAHYLKTVAPDKSLNEIIGGRDIKPETRALAALITQPYLKSGTTPQQWDLSNGDINHANAPKSTLRLQLLNSSTASEVDRLYNSRDLYGRRLTIGFDASNHAIVRLDGVVEQTSTTAFTDARVKFTVAHGYSGAGENVTQSLSANSAKLYAVVNSWGTVRESGVIEKRRKWLQDYQNQGVADTAAAEKVMGEALTLLGTNWVNQCDKTDRIGGQLSNFLIVRHHRVGIAGQGSAPFVDLPLSRSSGVELDATPSFDRRAASFFAIGGITSALEHGVIEQTQAINAVSTVKLLDIANTNHEKFYFVTPTNISALTPTLTGSGNSSPYTSGELTAETNAGRSILLPEHKNVVVGSYSGTTKLAISENQTTGALAGRYLIGPGLAGGFATQTASKPNVIQTLKTEAKAIVTSITQASKDPVELWKGSFLLDSDDFSVGPDELPLGLGLQRSYSSGSRTVNGVLGYGWRHNFDITVSKSSNAAQAFGEDSALDASTLIAGIYALSEVLEAGRTRDRLLVSALGQSWLADQIKDNLLSVEVPGNTQRFIKLQLPGGVAFNNPPPGSADVLTVLASNAGYSLLQKNGVKLTFDNEGKITEWWSPGGTAADNKLTFAYDNATNGKRLLSVSSSYGRTLTFAYDASGTTGRISSVTDGTGRTVAYAYDPTTGNLVSFTNPLGHATTYAYDSRRRMTKFFSPEYPTNALAENIYDALDRVKEQLNPHGKRSYLYISGTRGEEVDPLGHSKVYTFSDSGKTLSETDGTGRTVTMEYDVHDRLLTQTAPEGNSLSYEYDVNHNVKKITQTAKSGCSGSCTDIVQEFLYELNPALGHYNKLTQATDALGRVTDYSYYTGTPNLQKVEQPLVGGVRPTTQFLYTSKGQLETQTDAEGRVTEYTYNTNGLVTSVVRDAGSGRLNLTESFTYDARGDVATATDARGYTSTFGYDAARRRVSSTTPLVTGTVTPSQSYVTTVKVDKNGRVVETRTATGNVAAPVQVQTTVYSKSDKVLASLDPEGNATSFVYDDADRLVEVTDAEGRVTQQTYYDDDRPFETRQLVGGTPVTVRKTTYTGNGQVLTVKDGQNTVPADVTTYGYDGFDRLLTTTYPNGKVESLTYNATGTVATRKTRNNETFSFAYDALDRLVSKDPPGANNTIVTTYDKTGLVDLVTVNGTSTFDHDYDTAGRLVKVTRPDGKVVEYTVDAGGSRTSVKYPGTPAYTVNTSYDELGRPKEVKENGTTVLASWSYPDRLSGTVTYANATTRAVEATLSGELKQLTNSLSGEAPQFRHYYNRTGQVTNRRVSVPAYEYSPPGTGSAGYTSNKLNQYTAVASVTHTYNNNGNLTGDGTWTYTYDAENRLTGASKTGTSASYVYDAFGRREQKTVNGTVTKYLLDGGQVLEEYDGSNVRTARYVYAPGIDEPLFMERGGNRYFYHFDGQGSVVALTGTNGAVAERYSYGAYGESQSTSAVGNPYRYTGRELDGETGLYYYRARYYSAGLGRFMQPDPIGYGDGLNLYAYVGNDPLNLVDPSGLFGDKVMGAAKSLYHSASQALPSIRSPNSLSSIPTQGEIDAINERELASFMRLSASFVAPIGAAGRLGAKGDLGLSASGLSKFVGTGAVVGRSASLTLDFSFPVSAIPNTLRDQLKLARSELPINGVAKISETIGRAGFMGIKRSASINQVGDIDAKIGFGFVFGSSGTYPVIGIGDD